MITINEMTYLTLLITNNPSSNLHSNRHTDPGVPSSNNLSDSKMPILNHISLFSIILGLSLITHGEYTEHRHEKFSDNYELQWHIDYDLQKVLFQAFVHTEGFVGFGISPTGGMAGADIFIAGVFPNGTSYSSDRFGSGRTEPEIDAEQNWNLIEASFKDNLTVISFSRDFETCDKFDVPLTNDTTNFIWSYGDSDNISYHGTTNRGVAKVQPLDPQPEESDLSKYDFYEIKHTMIMPSADTTYWCTIERSPLFTQKHHIVAFEPLLNSPEALAHTHHYNIFRCRAPEGVDPEEFFEPYVNTTGGECYVPNPVIPVPQCQTMFYNWAVGGKMLILPLNIGYPIGETGSERDYYMFEIHYSNPSELPGVEFETGAKIYYTNEPRELDAGLMVVAHHTSISLTVPPKSEGYKTVGHCDPQCTQEFLPADGINVFGIFLHAHLSGRKMKFRQFRGDQELPWPANDDQYDFEYQQTRLLHEEVKVLRGDQLTMECTYDTTWHDGVTVGGLSTKDEMCQSIFWYYPRAELRDCRSEYPIEEVFSKFGITSANRSTPYEDAVITSPEEFQGMKYSEVLNSRVEWTQDLRNELQRDSVEKSHVGVCWTDTQSKKIPVTGYPSSLTDVYEPINKCSANNSAGNRLEHQVNFLLLAAVCFVGSNYLMPS